MELLNSFIESPHHTSCIVPSPQTSQDLHLIRQATHVPRSYRKGLCHQIRAGTWSSGAWAPKWMGRLESSTKPPPPGPGGSRLNPGPLCQTNESRCLRWSRPWRSCSERLTARWAHGSPSYHEVTSQIPTGFLCWLPLAGDPIEIGFITRFEAVAAKARTENTRNDARITFKTFLLLLSVTQTSAEGCHSACFGI